MYENEGKVAKKLRKKKIFNFQKKREIQENKKNGILSQMAYNFPECLNSNVTIKLVHIFIFRLVLSFHRWMWWQHWNMLSLANRSLEGGYNIQLADVSYAGTFSWWLTLTVPVTEEEICPVAAGEGCCGTFVLPAQIDENGMIIP